MEKLHFQNVDFEGNFMQFAKYYDFFARGFIYRYLRIVLFQDRPIETNFKSKPSIVRTIFSCEGWEITPYSNERRRNKKPCKPYQSIPQAWVVCEGELLTPTELKGSSILEWVRFFWSPRYTLPIPMHNITTAIFLIGFEILQNFDLPVIQNLVLKCLAPPSALLPHLRPVY